MLIWILIAIGAVALDQGTKALAVAHLKPIDTYPIVRDVLHFTYCENRGAAFSMLEDHPAVFMTISSIAIVALSVYLVRHRKESKWLSTALTFIIAGGVGNMIDRIGKGYVVDMVDFRLINFAVFNVADSFVCVGAGMLIFWLIRGIVQEIKEEKAKKSTAETEPTDPPQNT